MLQLTFWSPDHKLGGMIQLPPDDRLHLPSLCHRPPCSVVQHNIMSANYVRKASYVQKKNRNVKWQLTICLYTSQSSSFKPNVSSFFLFEPDNDTSHQFLYTTLKLKTFLAYVLYNIPDYTEVNCVIYRWEHPTLTQLDRMCQGKNSFYCN